MCSTIRASYFGARAVEHRPADAGLAGDRPGRRVRCRPPARRRNGGDDIFAGGGRIADCQAYYDDVRARARRGSGATPSTSRSCRAASSSSATPTRGARETGQTRQPRASRQRHRLIVDRARACDASKFDLDARCPISRKATKEERPQRVIDRARRDNLTVRQLAQIAGGYGGLSMVGTPKTIADQMEEWFYARACDGFNIMFPWVPGGSRRIRRPGRPRTAAAWPVPHRIRGQDLARKPRPAPSANRFFPETKGFQ